jgi:hypothetical protein
MHRGGFHNNDFAFSAGFGIFPSLFGVHYVCASLASCAALLVFNAD